MPDRDLNHNSAFMRLWAGESASQVGFQVAQLTTPAIAITLLHATNSEVGILNGLQTLAFLLVGLPAGAWVDRWRKRRTMIAADLVRLAALATVPLAWAWGTLTLPHLMVVSAILGFGTVFFDVAYQSYVPSIVKPHQIGDANGRLEASFQLARVAGPGLAGWLLGLVAAPFAHLLTASTLGISACAIASIPGREERPRRPEDSSLWRQVREGLDFVLGERLLAPLFVCISASAFTGQGVQVLLPVLALRELGMSATTLGTIISLSAIGGILGVLTRPWLTRGLGEGHTIVVTNVAGVSVMFALPLTSLLSDHAWGLLVGACMVNSYFMTIYNITQMSLRQRLCPKPLLGRLNATFRFAVWGVMPLGSLLAGWCADQVGVSAALAIFIAGTVLSGLAMGLTPVARQNRIDPDFVPSGGGRTTTGTPRENAGPDPRK